MTGLLKLEVGVGERCCRHSVFCLCNSFLFHVMEIPVFRIKLLKLQQQQQQHLLEQQHQQIRTMFNVAPLTFLAATFIVVDDMLWNDMENRI